MRKLLALLLALLIIISAAPLATAEETVLTVGGWPAGDTAFKAIIPAFEAAHPGVKVELVFMSTADHHQQLATAIAAGSGASDVVMLEQAWVGRFKDGEGFENLLAEPYNAGSLKDQFVEYKWNLATSVDQSRMIGLVWDIGPATLFYRRDIFEDAGLPSDPAEVDKLFSTWDGFLQAAEKVYIPGKRWLVPSASYLYEWFWMNRDFYNEKLELNVEKPGALDALNAAIAMRQKGLDAQIDDMWSNEANAAFGSGAIAAVAAGCWYGGFLKSWIAPDAAGKWGVAHMPGGLSTSNWGGSYLAIPSQSPHKDLAWEFIKFACATSESQNAMFQAVDYFPGFIPAWDSDIYSAEDPYFGGQKTRELWVEIAKNTNPTFATLMDQAAEAAMQTAVRSGLNESKTAEEIIADMKARIENDTRDDFERMQELMEDAGLL
jgi:multiple sugar transport system substrate-binding protein